jgi:hypothetical protein
MYVVCTPQRKPKCGQIRLVNHLPASTTHIPIASYTTSHCGYIHFLNYSHYSLCLCHPLPFSSLTTVISTTNLFHPPPSTQRPIAPLASTDLHWLPLLRSCSLILLVPFWNHSQIPCQGCLWVRCLEWCQSRGRCHGQVGRCYLRSINVVHSGDE